MANNCSIDIATWGKLMELIIPVVNSDLVKYLLSCGWVKTIRLILPQLAEYGDRTLFLRQSFG